MKRLIRSFNYKTAQDRNFFSPSNYVGDDFSNLGFLKFLKPITKENIVKKEITATELVILFKNWFIENWIEQGNNPEQLKYVGLLPDDIFMGWVYSIYDSFYINEVVVAEAKFLLQSERILK